MILNRPLLQNLDRKMYMAFAAIVLFSVAASVYTQNQTYLAFPFLLIGGLVAILDYSFIFYILLFSLPFSMQTGLPGGMSMDMPTEPLMLMLTGCFLMQVITGGIQIERRFITHPLLLILLTMYVWAMYSALFSVSHVKSIKYLLAKIWYIVPFVLFTGTLIRSVKSIRKVWWTALGGVVLIVAYGSIHHTLLGLGFDTANDAYKPFFINHVIYAAMVALFVPVVFFEILLNKNNSLLRNLCIAILCLFLFAVITSYTRASWLSLPVAAIFFVVLRYRLTKKILVVAYVAVAAIAFYFIQNNNYLKYSPDYEKTIFNEGNLEKHLEATYKFEDVSGMERVYRWIAAVRMAGDHPIVGTGPSTFYPEYKRYTVRSFETYVSDNPEKSTTHNYFLLQLAEQGLVGLLLFVTLISYLLILVERLYHRTKVQHYKYLVLGAGLSLVVTIFHLLLNELIEVDKIGAFFFICIAILIKLDIWTKEEVRAQKEA
ncbi:MAG: O-antigen ligase family protein [Hymenobacteraceae bacterium]|nr:O-antigen ligase family protein [Hymenobacteraceae bacterium]MDX5396590.1 O-antigen ligase family protein [Hymenobacteraceae bacterium]MDX5512653.1 O-antigen ligase family protein [Hymenobacteraceae bacterium]